MLSKFLLFFIVFCNDTATTETYTYGHTHPLPDALPISVTLEAPPNCRRPPMDRAKCLRPPPPSRSTHRRAPTPSASRAGRNKADRALHGPARSEEHTSELKSLMRISYAVFCLNKNKKQHTQ